MNSLKLKVQGLAGMMKESKIPGHIYLKNVIKNQVHIDLVHIACQY